MKPFEISSHHGKWSQYFSFWELISWFKYTKNCAQIEGEGKYYNGDLSLTRLLCSLTTGDRLKNAGRSGGFLMAINSISHSGEIILFVQNRVRGVFRSMVMRSASDVQVGNKTIRHPSRLKPYSPQREIYSVTF